MAINTIMNVPTMTVLMSNRPRRGNQPTWVISVPRRLSIVQPPTMVSPRATTPTNGEHAEAESEARRAAATRAGDQPTDPGGDAEGGEHDEHELPSEARIGLGDLAHEVPGVERQRADDQHGDGERRQRAAREHDPGETVAEPAATARLQRSAAPVAEW